MPDEKTPQKKSTNILNALFEQIDDLIQTSVKQSELMDAVRGILRALGELDKKLTQNIAQNKGETETSLKSLETLIKDTAKLLKQATDAVEQKSTKRLADAVGQLNEKVNTVQSLIPDLPDYSSDFNALNERVARLDEITIGTNIRNALEALPEGEKLAIGAVDGLRTELDELKKRPVGKVGGITDKAIQFALMRSIQAVTPSGTIDGANTDFEVPSTIHAVLSFELNSRVVALGEYEIVGGARKTIRFDTAPSASYSGKSFVITYI